MLLARLISTHILTIDYFSNGTCPLANDLEMTIQYLSNDQDVDVKSYFSWSNNTNEKPILPPYDDLFRNKLDESSDNSNANTSTSNNNNELNLEMKNSNFIYNCNELEKIDIIKNNTNSSLPTTEPTSKIANTDDSNLFTSKNSNKLVYGASNSHNQDDDDDEDEVENMEEDDEDDDEDEIIDKTKINQLKIVNLENDLDSESTN